MADLSRLNKVNYGLNSRVLRCPQAIVLLHVIRCSVKNLKIWVEVYITGELQEWKYLQNFLQLSHVSMSQELHTTTDMVASFIFYSAYLV